MQKYFLVDAGARRGALVALALAGVFCAAPALAAVAAPRSAPVAAPTLLVLGDSLSAEYGLKRGAGWVALLEQRLATLKRDVKVVNASISGDTTSGGRSRLPALLAQHRPSHVVIELGGNDALRGLPLAMTRDNLEQMAQAAQAAGARLLLVGMQVPPNYGADYTRAFADTFASVARKHKAALVPFLLHGVADRPDAEKWFQADRIHPREEAQPLLLDNVWPELKKILP
jgi:acyl-CoA thioesterase-1